LLKLLEIVLQRYAFLDVLRREGGQMWDEGASIVYKKERLNKDKENESKNYTLRMTSNLVTSFVKLFNKYSSSSTVPLRPALRSSFLFDRDVRLQRSQLKK